MSMRWKVLALLLRSRAKIRLMLANMYKSREKMKLYCHLFPSDYEFDRDTLVQLWMAMGFSSRRCAEDFCKRYFDILLKEQHILFSRIDLLTGRKMYIVDQYKITPPLNGIQTIRNEDNLDDFTLLEDENTCGPKSCHISLVANDNINQTTFEKLKSFGNELKSLLFIRKHGSSLKKLPSNLFLSFELLHALDLSGSQIIELPTSIGNVRQLHYLDLSFTLIESLPECIDRLHQLQTLKLGGCKHLFELPKGMKELICLRYLDFDVLGQLSFLPKGIGALTELQMLSAFIVDDSEEGCSIRELKTMNNLSGSFCISGLKNVSFDDFDEAGLQHKKYVTHLQLRWNELQIYSTEDQLNAYYIIDKLNLSENLTDLQITCFPGLTFSPWVKWREHGKLVSITLLKCENKDLALSLGLLPNLKYLNIIHMNRVREIDILFRGVCESNYAAFPKLEKLEIDCMFSIECWTDVSCDDFQLLSKLIIKRCPKLIRLPFLPHLQSLKHLEISYCTVFECLPNETLPASLETLIIDDCPLLNKRFAREGEDWHKIKHVSNIWIDLEDICSTQEEGVDENNDSTTENIGSIDQDVEEVDNIMIDAEDLDVDDSHGRDQNSTMGLLEASPETLIRTMNSHCIFEMDYVPLWGFRSICGRRAQMEDALASVPCFQKLPLKFLAGDDMFNGMNPSLSQTAHFYGVYDGNGGSEVAKYCRDRLHVALAEEIESMKMGPQNGSIIDNSVKEWEKAFSRVFLKIDAAVGGINQDRLKPFALETVGSTAIVSVVCLTHILVANCGDSRAVLCRAKAPMPLSVDHKPHRKDEWDRIEAAGGMIIEWNGYRVLGVLKKSRSIGHRYLKPWIIPDPEVMVVPRSKDDDCLILASDGLWDVMTNEEACVAARRQILLWRKKNEASISLEQGKSVDPAAQAAADYLTKLALQKGSKDNISVIVVDLN
ncbi:hypothetical protein BVRB_6g151180 [Beta vulgaris subsp. vulgaris]|nr:hypothetical protein BVRB_6g151180 [Beta vulgaris subsp. vulgaris]